MERIYCNEDWLFTEQFEESLLEANMDESRLKKVRLPHTCKELPFHYFDEKDYQMISGYRKVLEIPKQWEGKTVLLTFEGVGHVSEVYLNGEKVGSHQCGYTAFTIDLSDKLSFGQKNILVVKVDSREVQNVPPFGFVIDYMTYGGIYRDVYFEIGERTYIQDVFVTTKISGKGMTEKQGVPFFCEKSATSTKVTFHGEVTGQKVYQYLREKGTEDWQELGFLLIPEKETEMIFQTGQRKLWSVEYPNLYELKTVLVDEDEKEIDEKIVTFGYRKAIFKKNGFYLNGKKVKLRGLNRHQSYPYVGYAMPESMQKMDADILKKELGLNAVRTSHYPQSHYFMDRCDELGLLVFTEMPGWQHIGDEMWKKQAVQNVEDMILQYRNHPSIILWGVRINESVDDDDFYERTNAVAHSLDESRPTGGVRCYKKSNLLEDVYTYNDFSHDGNKKGCEKKSAVTSDVEKPYLISEYNGHMYPTKAFDWEEHRVEHAMRHVRVLDEVYAQEDIAGCFGWCMFDYNTHKDFGSGDRICYHGVMDMFRNPKLASAIYAMQQDEKPVLMISSSMDIGEHPGCNRNETYIFTNADSVRMYKNDVLIKEYQTSRSEFQNIPRGPIRIDDYVGNALAVYEGMKGKQEEEVKALLNEVARVGLYGMSKAMWVKAAKVMVLYHMSMEDATKLFNKYVGDWGGTSTAYRFEAVKDGEVIATLLKTPMTKRKLKVTVSHTDLVEKNSYDVAAVRMEIVDENDNLLYFFNDPVSLSVTGDLELVGPEIIGMQGGMGGTYIRSKGKSGNGTLTIAGEAMETVTIDFSISERR